MSLTSYYVLNFILFQSANFEAKLHLYAIRNNFKHNCNTYYLFIYHLHSNVAYLDFYLLLNFINYIYFIKSNNKIIFGAKHFH